MRQHASGGPWSSAKAVISDVTNGLNYKVVLPKRSVYAVQLEPGIIESF